MPTRKKKPRKRKKSPSESEKALVEAALKKSAGDESEGGEVYDIPARSAPKPEEPPRDVYVDVGWKPFPEQSEFIYSPARFCIAAAGTRGGKSEAGAFKLAMKALENGGVPEDGSDMPKTIRWIVAPTYGMLTVPERMFFQMLDPFPEFIIARNRKERWVELASNCRVEFKSAEWPDTLRAAKVSDVWIDEGAYVKPEAIRILRARVSDTLGGIDVTTTTKGKNWVYEWFLRGRDESNKAYASFRWESRANPYFPASEWEESKKDLPEDFFRQEFMAEFLEDAAGVFRRIDAIVETADTVDAAGPFFLGLDLARIHDATVQHVLAADGQTVDWFRLKGMDWAEQKSEILRIADKWDASIIMDSTGGQGDIFYQELTGKLGLARVTGIKFTMESKRQLVQTLQTSIEKRDITIPKIDVLIDELKWFEYKRTQSGNLVYSAPKGYHDDCLLEGTLIKTIEGYRPIESVKRGDLVMTHKGRYKRVEGNLKKPFNGKMHKMKFINQIAIDLSYNHPVYAAMRSYVGGQSGDYIKREWILPGDWKKTYRAVTSVQRESGEAVKSLCENDYYVNSKMANNIRVSEIEITPKFGRFLGKFIADGHVHKYYKKTGGYTLDLAFHENERKEAEWYSEFLKGLGIKSRIERVNRDSRGVKLSFNSKLFWHVLSETYDASQERCLPGFANRASRLTKRAILKGWLEGDGWSHASGAYVIGCTTSRRLALEMRDFALEVGKYATIQHCGNRSRYGKPCKDQYWVAVHDKCPVLPRSRPLLDGDYGSGIRKHKEYLFDGFVYNLQIEEDRSFIANGIVVHNCVWALALANWGRLHQAGSRIPAIIRVDTGVLSERPYSRTSGGALIGAGNFSGSQQGRADIWKRSRFRGMMGV